MKLHAGDIEVAIARFYGWRNYLIVPNVGKGLGFGHELDLLVVTPSRYAYEFEIKVSVADLKADRKKSHQHESEKIKRFFFAVPKYLQSQARCIIPERAGLIIVWEWSDRPYFQARIVKPGTVNPHARKLTDKEYQRLGELATMRVWSLKKRVYQLQRELDYIKGCKKLSTR